MNKLFSKVIGASLAIAMMIGAAVGVYSNREAREANADSSAMSAGSNSAAVSVSFNGGDAVDGVRIGTSKNAGSATFTVPMNTTSVSFYAVGWKSTATTISVSISAGSITPATWALTSNDAATGSINDNAELSISGDEEDCFKSFTTSNVTSSATVTIASSGSNRRSIVWGASYEGGSSNVYTVTFESNGGTDVTAIDVSNSGTAKVNKPTDPTKRGFSFVGWYNEALTEAYDFNRNVTGDITLYAKWEKPALAESYSQSLDNGDYHIAGEVTAITGSTDFFVQNGNNVMRVNSAPGEIKVGNSVDLFGAFSKTSGKMSNLVYCDVTENDETVSQTPITNLNNATAENEYKYFVLNNIQLSSGFSSNKATLKDSDAVLYYYSSTYVNAGGTFTPNSFAANDYISIKGVITKHNSDLQLQITSIEKPTQYTVTFVSNGGSAVPSQNVLAGETLQQPANPSRASDEHYDYTFAGWYRDNEFQQAYNFASVVNESFILYAKWDETEIAAAQAVTYLDTTSSLTYRYSKEIGQSADDILDNATTGITGTSYNNWTSSSNASGVSYKGQSAGDHDSIQLRSSNSNSGVVVTANANNRTAVSITVKWESHSSSERIVDVYGKNTAYTDATELYSSNVQTQGTKIGSSAFANVDENNETTITVDGSYKFVAFRSRSGALYLESIKIEWSGTQTYRYSNVGVRFKGLISTTLWEKLNNESTIQGYGFMYTTAEYLNGLTIKGLYGLARDGESSVEETFTAVQEKEYKMVKDTEIKSFYTPLANSEDHPVQVGDDYGWNFFKNISDSELGKPFTAVAYIRTASNEIIFFDEITKSAAQLAQDLIDAENEYDETSLEGSLADLASKA